jgi:trehalose 6-phosphate synthase
VPRLVVVSNRVAVPDPEGPRLAGGLAVAVNAALKHREGLWFGWSGQISRNGSDNNRPSIVERRQRSFVTIDLSENDYH